MPDDRENYCRLIGLNPTKENSYDYAGIEKKIAAKEAKWKKESENKQNDLDKRFQMSEYLALVPDMRKVMRDPGSRAREFENGRQVLRSKASKLAKESVTLHDGSKVLIPGTADTMVKKLQWEGVTKDDLIAIAGIKRTSVPPVVSDRVITAYKSLREVNAFTPMEILNDLIENRNLEIQVKPLTDGSSLVQIRSAFEVCEKRVNSVRPDTLQHQDSYIQSLRSLKLVLNPDAALADLIKYGKCMKILAPAMLVMEEEYSQPFTRDYIDDILNSYLRNTNADRDMAVSILEEFCVRKKLLANFSAKDSKLVQCKKCGSFVESGGQIMCCSVCGSSIRTKCPQCGTDQPSDNKACIRCGFDFQDGLRKAKELEDKFRSNLNSGLIDDASNNLTEIRRIYSSYPELSILTEKLKSAASKYNSAIRNIDQSFKLKKFHDVFEYSRNYVLEFPTILVANLELRKKTEESARRMKEADDLCNKAADTDDKDEKLRLYAAASEKCPDHPVAKSKMAEYPPESPADATAQVREGKVLIKFAVPAERTGMSFCIYRSPYTLPVVTEDTVPLAEIPGSVYLDKTLDPGVDYYYSIHSKRWGVLSREATSCGPAIAFVEVENVSIEPIQDGLKIIYEKPKGCSRVRIWRKEGTTAAGLGDEVELVHDGEPVIEDRGLKGGVKYHYLFVAEYVNKDKTERSMGTDFSCTTVRFPEPVRDMEIKWNKSDGSYTAKWRSKENVVLYSSPKKVTMYGRMIKMEDINTWLSEIQPLEMYDDGMRFMLPDGAVQYIYPMIPIGKTAVRGRDMMVANLKPFRDVEKRISGSDCDITMNWPTDAESAIIVVKDSATDDANAERISISREAYNTDRKVRIAMGNSKKRIVTLYAVYDVSGEKMNSRGMSIEVYSGAYSKIRYTMSIEKVTKTEGKLMINIDTDPGVTTLPPMAAIRVSEGIPLKIWDGEAIWSSDKPTILSAGKATVSIPCDPKMDLSKVRLFFKDEEDYHVCRFIHPIYKDR